MQYTHTHSPHTAGFLCGIKKSAQRRVCLQRCPGFPNKDASRLHGLWFYKPVEGANLRKPDVESFHSPLG